MQLSDLLTDPALDLRLLTEAGADGEIRWVAATELADPTPFLDGGELVLTTGLAFLEGGPQAFVDRLADAGVAALGFAVGLGHDDLIDGLVAAAAARRLPVVAVPYDTPFVAIARQVAEGVIAARYRAEIRAVEIHEQLARLLLAGAGVSGLTQACAELVGAPCALIDFHGRVLTSSPPEAGWPIGPIMRRRTDTGPWRLDDLAAFPVLLEGEIAAILASRAVDGDQSVFRTAVTMLGLELARQAAVLTGRRLLLGQVLEDVVHHVISDEEATRRLERLGIDVEIPHAALVGATPGPEDRLQQVTWAVQTLIARRGDPVHTALVDGRLVIVAEPSADPGEIARITHERLRRLSAGAAVGVGAAHTGVGGLRRSLLEAVSSVGNGPGVHDATGLSLAATVYLDRSGRPIAEAILAPLVQHDRQSGGDLLDTLVTYLRSDCRPGPAAAALNLHRNGLSYRLARIEELTGRDLGSLEDRVELVLAARATGHL